MEITALANYSCALQRPRLRRGARQYRSARHITLHEAVQLALQHNHNVHIAEYKVEAKQHAKEVAKSAYFPTIRNESNFMHLTDTQLIQIRAGSLGGVAGSPVPPAMNYQPGWA